MARPRSSSKGKESSNRTSNKANAENVTPNKESKVSALSPDLIQELLAGSRTRGAGTEVIKDFIDSGEAGIEVDLNSGPLAGKNPGQAYTTLVNAKKRTKTNEDGSTVLAMPEAAKVRVIKRNAGTKDAPEFQVFLINTELVDVGNEGE
jgi:hypothetical protein